MDILDNVKDNRTACVSLLLKTSVKDYLDLITSAYRVKGGLEGQRAPLTTASAKRIRERLVNDLSKGAVLPPIVIGVVLSESEQEMLVKAPILKDYLSGKDLFIIDGMQRTTALKEANSGGGINSNPLRVEVWVAEKKNQLIYRMLVLNTGQIPWGIRRQLEVIFRKEIVDLGSQITELGLNWVDEKKRRNESGIYQADDVVELFVNFSTRKLEVDLQDEIADRFAKLDIIESTSNQKFSDEFFQAIGCMVKLDKAFGNYIPLSNEEILPRFKKGQDIFSSHPARVGFIVAFARVAFGSYVKGNVGGGNRPQELTDKIEALIAKLDGLSKNDLANFFSLATLNEILTQSKSGKAGEFERDFFLKAFEKLLLENCETLDPCWRAKI